MKNYEIVSVIITIACLALVYMLGKQAGKTHVIEINSRVRVKEPRPDIDYHRHHHLYIGRVGTVVQISVEAELGALVRVRFAENDYWFEPEDLEPAP